jgi:uncharacterized protein YndB with AHSA1/START domain
MPEHITQWNHAGDDWHCPAATNDLRVGGSFVATMAAKDGSVSFDFIGIYDEIVQHASIAYHMPDNRKVEVSFRSVGDATEVIETFDPENEHPPEMQQAGWQMILDNFKKHAEASR